MGVERFIGTALEGLVFSTGAMRQNCVMVSLDMNQHIYKALEKIIEDDTCQNDQRETKEKKKKGLAISFMFETTPSGLKEKFKLACKDVIDSIITELDQIIHLREVRISVDGYPCTGKIQNQIERRKKVDDYYANYKQHFDKDNNPVKANDKYQDGTPKSVPSKTKVISELVFSNSMIIPGTELMDIFVTIMTRQFTAFQERRKFFLAISGPDIPGEGEHKAIDDIRRSPHTSFASMEQNQSGAPPCTLLWSNDSDVIISLLHQDYINIYIMTNHIKGEETIQKCIDLADIRKVFIRSPKDHPNVSLLLAFQGNDYLPQMMDTLDLKISYDRHRSLGFDLTMDPHTKINLTLQENDEVTQSNTSSEQSKTTRTVRFNDLKDQSESELRQLNFGALQEFFKAMAQQEIELYHISYGEDRFARSQFRPENLRTAISEKVEFKRKYYKEVLATLSKAYNGKIPTFDLGESATDLRSQPSSNAVSQTPYLKIDTENPTDQELYILEMNMTAAYLKTYVWYYYYQSGFAVNAPLDNSFYPYGMAPLYCSLYIMLNRGPIELRAHFDHNINPSIKPIRREPTYFQSLPMYKCIHHFSVLQTNHLRIVYPEPKENTNGLVQPRSITEKQSTDYSLVREIEEDNPDFINIKETPSVKSSIKSRRGGAFVSIYPFMPIWSLITRYGASVNQAPKSIIQAGEKPISNTTTNARRNKYRLRGTAVFND